MKLKRTKYEMVIEILCLMLLIGVMVYLFLEWKDIPDLIPGHYNAMGEVDRMGNKGELLVLPIIGWIMYIVITILEQIPQIWNTGVTVTEENKERVYRIIKNMISTMKLTVVAVFVFITINSSQEKSLPIWFLPVFLILMFGPMIYFIVKLVKAK